MHMWCNFNQNKSLFWTECKWLKRWGMRQRQSCSPKFHVYQHITIFSVLIWDHMINLANGALKNECVFFFFINFPLVKTNLEASLWNDAPPPQFGGLGSSWSHQVEKNCDNPFLHGIWMRYTCPELNINTSGLFVSSLPSLIWLKQYGKVNILNGW